MKKLVATLMFMALMLSAVACKSKDEQVNNGDSIKDNSVITEQPTITPVPEVNKLKEIIDSVKQKADNIIGKGIDDFAYEYKVNIDLGAYSLFLDGMQSIGIDGRLMVGAEQSSLDGKLSIDGEKYIEYQTILDKGKLFINLPDIMTNAAYTDAVKDLGEADEYYSLELFKEELKTLLNSVYSSLEEGEISKEDDKLEYNGYEISGKKSTMYIDCYRFIDSAEKFSEAVGSGDVIEDKESAMGKKIRLEYIAGSDKYFGFRLTNADGDGTIGIIYNKSGAVMWGYDSETREETVLMEAKTANENEGTVTINEDDGYKRFKYKKNGTEVIVYAVGEEGTDDEAFRYNSSNAEGMREIKADIDMDEANSLKVSFAFSEDYSKMQLSIDVYSNGNKTIGLNGIIKKTEYGKVEVPTVYCSIDEIEDAINIEYVQELLMRLAERYPNAVEAIIGSIGEKENEPDIEYDDYDDEYDYESGL